MAKLSQISTFVVKMNMIFNPKQHRQLMAWLHVRINLSNN